jgi:hypothetical protein
MKKIIVAFSLFVFAITNNSFAQNGGVQVALGDVNFSAGKMKEGVNTVTKAGQGTLQFVKKGNSFSEVIFKDESGTTTTLIPTPAGTGGTPNLENKTKSTDACFGTANKSYGVCATRSGNIYTVTFMRAGVQKWVATFQ